MSFGTPALLGLLALAPLVAVALYAARRWQAGAAARYAGRRNPRELISLLGAGRWALRLALLTAAVALVAVAAARPQAGSQPVTVERSGIDLMLVLDVSQSMDARDATPSRLGRAQDEVAALLERLQGDRAGLVIFARGAVLRSPLSTDLRAVGQQVMSASRDRGLLLPGTGLAAAIDAATHALTEGTGGSPAGGAGPGAGPARAILIVSDGEDHEGRALDAVLRATQKAVRTYAAGVGGREGTVIPEAGPGAQGGELVPKVDPNSGEVVITRLNDDLLRRLAEAGDGRYVPLEVEGQSLTSLSDDFAALKTAVFSTSQERRPVERFQWFAAAALAALALDGVAVAWRGAGPRARALRRPWLAGLALLGLVTAACAASVHGLNDEGNRLYREGAYAESLDAYQRAAAERPDLAELSNNAANALHRLGLYDRAGEETRRGLRSARGPLAARLYYGLGNHLFRAGRLIEALDAYRWALVEDPSDVDAKYNLEVVLSMLSVRPGEAGGQGSGSGMESPLPTQPGPGEGGAPRGGPGEPGAAVPGTAFDGGRAERIQRDLEQALAGIDRQFTIEEALRVLDLLREQGLATPLDAEPAAGAGPDY